MNNIRKATIVAIESRVTAAKAKPVLPVKSLKLKTAVVFQNAEEWSTFTTLAKTFDSLTSSDAGDSALRKTYTNASDMSKDVKEVIKFFGGACYSEVGKNLLDHFTDMLEDQVANSGFPAK